MDNPELAANPLFLLTAIKANARVSVTKTASGNDINGLQKGRNIGTISKKPTTRYRLMRKSPGWRKKKRATRSKG